VTCWRGWCKMPSSMCKRFCGRRESQGTAAETTQQVNQHLCLGHNYSAIEEG
jgi:hypothetical protein